MLQSINNILLQYHIIMQMTHKNMMHTYSFYPDSRLDIRSPNDHCLVHWSRQ